MFLFYLQVDLRHLSQKGNNNNVRLGMDLQEYYISTEWDVMSVPAIRNEKYYPCCEEPYIDITFTVGLRRKSLFYTVNVILPCVGISFLSVLVFYLPSDSGEKVTEIANIELLIKIILSLICVLDSNKISIHIFSGLTIHIHSSIVDRVLFAVG